MPATGVSISPAPSFAMTDDDLDAMFAYLQSVPPIKHHVPQPVPTAPQASASR